MIDQRINIGTRIRGASIFADPAEQCILKEMYVSTGKS